MKNGSSIGDANHIDEEPENFETWHKPLFVAYDDLKPTNCNGYSSILSNEVEKDRLKNIFTIPLIPGLTNDFSATYTDLWCAHDIVVWRYGKTSKTIASLDLKLFEKKYLLVCTLSDLIESYI